MKTVKTVSELESWLEETLQVFPEIKRKAIRIDYKPISIKALGRVKAKIKQKLDFDPEALLLGEQQQVRKRRLKPKRVYYSYKQQDTKCEE